MATESSTKVDLTASLVEKALKEPSGIIAIIAIALGGVCSWFGVQVAEGSLKALVAGGLLVVVGLTCAVVWGVRRLRAKGHVDQGKIKGWIETPPSAAIRGALSFNVHDDLPGEARRRLAAKIAASVLDPGFQAGVVYGKPGVGKTSLLFAGVAKILNQRSPPVRVQLVDCRTTQPGRLREAGFDPIAPKAGPNSTGEATDPEKVVIVDQFEEWLVPAAQTGDFDEIKSYLKQLRNAEIRLILGIRYDHAVLINHFLQDVLRIHQRYWELVQPLSTQEATQIVQECAALDKLPFAPALAELIANDLTHEGVVWLVELQIVLYELLQQPTADGYRRRGGAAGILSDFIRGTVLRSADPMLTRDVLRLLTTAKDAIGISVSGLPTYDVGTMVHELQKLRPGLTEKEVLGALDSLSEHRIIGEFRHEGTSSQVPVYRLNHDYLRLVVAKALEEPLSNTDNATQLAQTYLLQKDLVSDFEAPFSGLRYAARFGRPEVVNSAPFREMYRLARRRRLLRVVVPPTVAVLLTSVAFAAIAVEIVWDENQLSPSMLSATGAYRDVVFSYDVELSRVVGVAGPHLSAWDPDGKRITDFDAGDNFVDVPLLPRAGSPWVVWRNNERYTSVVDVRDGHKLALPATLKLYDEANDKYAYVSPVANDGRLIIAEHSCSQGNVTLSVIRPGESLRVTDTKVIKLDCLEIEVFDGPDPAAPPRKVKQSNLRFVWGRDSSGLMFTSSWGLMYKAAGPPTAAATAMVIGLQKNDTVEVSPLAVTEQAQELLATIDGPYNIAYSFYSQSLEVAAPAARDATRYLAPLPAAKTPTPAFASDAFPNQLLFSRVDAAGSLSILKLDIATGRVVEAFRTLVGVLVPDCDGLPATVQVADASADGFVLFLTCNDAKSRLVQRSIVHVPQKKGSPPRALLLDVRDRVVQQLPMYDSKDTQVGTIWQVQTGDKAVMLTPAGDQVPLPGAVLALWSDQAVAYIDKGALITLNPKTAEAKELLGGLPVGSELGYILNKDKILIADPKGKATLVDVGSRNAIETTAFVGAINKYYPCGSMIAWYRDGSTVRFSKVLKVLGRTVMSLNSCEAH